MKIKDIALSAAYVGQRVVKAIAVGAQEVWSAVKYIVFKDPVVEQICATNWGDGVGITEEQAASVADIPASVFQNNTEITSFDELDKFKSVKVLRGYSFNGCSSLRSIGLTNIVEIQARVFTGAPLNDCAMPMLSKMADEAFYQSNVKKVTNLGTIVKIGQRVFFGCASLSQLRIPNTVTIIDTNAVTNCSKLTVLEIDWSKITKIGQSAFYGCSELVIDDLSSPELAILGNTPFHGCKLKKISNLGQVPSLPASQHMFGKSLEEVILPDTCVNIGATGGYGPFEDNVSLTHVRLSHNTVMVGSRSFRNCTSLSKVDNLDSVQRIISMAFYGCPLTENETLHLSNLTELSGGAFEGSKIKRVTSLGNTTTIGGFSGCSELEYVNLHEGLTSIGSFYNCPKLGPELVLPSTLTSLGQNALNACPNLKTIICNAVTPPELHAAGSFDRRIETFYVPDGSVSAYKEASVWMEYADKILPMEAYLYGIITFADPAVEAICLANWDTNGSGYLNKEEAKAVTDIGTVFKGNTEITSFNEFEMFTGVKSINDAFPNCSALQSIKLPAGLETIDGACFYQDTNLTEVIIPPSVRTIGRSVFQQTGIASVEIPAGVEVIGGSAFSSCKSLVAVKLPEGLKRIENYGFSYCDNLSYLDIPSTVEYIGNWCFFGNKYIAYILRPTTPPELGDTNVFQTWWGYEENYTIYVPDASVDAYKAAPNWSTYADRIKPLSQYVEPTNE